jgi:hypothetical protein
VLLLYLLSFLEFYGSSTSNISGSPILKLHSTKMFQYGHGGFTMQNIRCLPILGKLITVRQAVIFKQKLKDNENKQN